MVHTILTAAKEPSIIAGVGGPSHVPAVNRVSVHVVPSAPTGDLVAANRDMVDLSEYMGTPQAAERCGLSQSHLWMLID